MTDNKQEKAKWLRLLRSRDHAAFVEFVEKYKERVFLCCLTLGLKEHEAEDAASETFLAAYRRISQFRGRAELGTWLWRIAYCTAINYLRKKHRRHQLLTVLNTKLVRINGSHPQTEAQSKEKEEIVWQAVTQLPRLWALAVVLYYREDKNVKDIAKIMRTKQNTIKTYLFRARKRLQELLADALGDDVYVSE